MNRIEELEKNLINVGLSEKERIVYISLFELGGRGFPSAIAKQAKLNRSTTYKILTALSIKGLVNDVEKNKKVYYQLNKPEKLLNYIEHQNKELNQKLQNLKKIAPDLNYLFSNLSQAPKVVFYEGYKEVKQIYFDMLNYKNYEMLAFFNAKEFEDYLTPEEMKKFTYGKEINKITMRAIVPANKSGRSFAEQVYGFMKRSKLFPDVRCIPENMFPYDGEITMYGKNKVAMFKLNKDSIDRQVIGVVIEDEMIHNMMKMIFELAWIGAEELDKK
ncbi:MAG: transcriptional regulator TrmB [Candidatus Taylorbacteria bacterium]|nr:transcriptional regulator TrmB [Candidatus Taylorbacteria bacterium]